MVPQQLEFNLPRFPSHSVLLPLLTHTHIRGAGLSRTQLQESSGERSPQVEARLFAQVPMALGPSFQSG